MARSVLKYWRNCVLTTLTMVVLAGIWYQATHVSSIDQVGIRYRLKCTAVLSQMIYGYPRDYTLDLRLLKFLSSVPDADPYSTKWSLERCAQVIKETVKAREWQSSLPEPKLIADDKGDFDFVRLAFYLFGVRIQSIFYAFFLVLFIGVVVYILDYFKSPSRLILLLFFLLSLYITVFITNLTDQLQNLTDIRFFDVLSVVPLFHLMLVLLDRRSACIRSLRFALVQTLLMIFVYHVRSSSMWQLMCFFLLTGVISYRYWKESSSLDSESGLGRFRRTMIRCGWPAALMIMGVISLRVYQRTNYNPDYFTEGYPRHTFWHNAFMGFACHPQLAKEFQIFPISDMNIILAAERYLKDHQDRKRWAMLYGEFRIEHFRWGLYETVVRDMFIATCLKHPVQVLETYLKYKPKILVQQFLWAAGFLSPDIDSLYLYSHTLTPEGTRREKDLFYNPLRWEVLILIMTSLVIGYGDLRVHAREIISLAALTLCFSLIPGFFTYPVIHIIGLVFVTVATFFYVTLSGVIIAAIRPVHHFKKPSQKGSRNHVTV